MLFPLGINSKIVKSSMTLLQSDGAILNLALFTRRSRGMPFGDDTKFRAKSCEREENAWVLGWMAFPSACSFLQGHPGLWRLEETGSTQDRP